MPRNGKRKKNGNRNVDVVVANTVHEDAAEASSVEPGGEERQQPEEDAEMMEVAVTFKMSDEMYENYCKMMTARLEEMEARLEKKMADNMEQFRAEVEALRAELRELREEREEHLRSIRELEALNALSGLLAFEDNHDDRAALRAIHARLLLDRSRQTAARALGLTKWEDIWEKGDAHAQIAFFKSAAEALPDSPGKDKLLAIGNNPGTLGMLLNRGNKIRDNFHAHHSEQSALRQAVNEM